MGDGSSTRCRSGTNHTRATWARRTCSARELARPSPATRRGCTASWSALKQPGLLGLRGDPGGYRRCGGAIWSSALCTVTARPAVRSRR